MLHHGLGRPAVCIAALLTATTAQADVTAQQVWADWQANFGLYGEDAVSVGSEEMSGDTLTISDFRIEMSQDEGSVEATIGTIAFTERGDGTVSVQMSEEIPVVVTGINTDDERQRIGMQVSTSGLDIVVSGTPEEMDYAILADRYALEVQDVTADGAAVPTEIVFALNGMNGNYVSRTGDLRNIDYAINANSLDLLFDVTDPEEGGSVDLSGTISDVSAQASVTLPLEASADDGDMMFANGFAFDGGYSSGGASYSFSLSQDGSTTDGTATTGAASLDVALDKDSMRYDASTTDVALNLSGTELPFPVSLGIAEYGVSLLAPMSSTPEPADFGFGLTLSELAVDPMIWDMFDPQGALPREPFTVLLDVTGTVRLFQDLLDPTQAVAMDDGEVPGEIHTLSLNTLEIRGAGASITGEGDFTFDNSDLETFDGMPRPEGSATFVVRGANALMDSLVQMGLLPQEQVMGARMMMGLFARSTGEDELTSTIEVNEEGHLLANGQRLQ